MANQYQQMRLTLGSFLGGALFGLGCSGSQSTKDSPADRGEHVSTAGIAGTRQQTIERLLDSLGLDFEGSLVAADSLETVSARDRSSDGRKLVSLVFRGRSARALLEQPVPVNAGYPSAEWIRIGTPGAVMLSISFRNTLEGYIATSISHLVGDSLVEVFRDSNAGECIPAMLRDIDGDGGPELIVYSETGTLGDCGHECYDAIREQFGLEFGWPEPRWWSGTDWRANALPANQYWEGLAKSLLAVRGGLTAGSMPACVPIAEDVLSLADLWRAKAAQLAGSASAP